MALDHTHLPIVTDVHTDAKFGWVGQYLAVNREGRPLELFRTPGIAQGSPSLKLVAQKGLPNIPCQSFAFPLHSLYAGRLEFAMLTDEGDLRRYLLTPFDRPEPLDTIRVDGAVCVEYNQSGDMIAVGCRDGMVHLFALDVEHVCARMVRQMSKHSIEALTFTEKGMLIARNSASTAFAYTGAKLKDGRLLEQGAAVEIVQGQALGLPDDFDVMCCAARPHHQQVVFGGLSDKAYLVKFDRTKVRVDGQPKRYEVRIDAVNLVPTRLKTFVRYAHWVTSSRFVLGDRNSLEMFEIASDGSPRRVDGFDFSEDHTALAFTEVSRRSYLVTAPYRAILEAATA